MEVPSSTSKVTVTYWDPSGLFPLIQSDLRSRLPLRNLHWKAPARPLRSINSLHVELTPYLSLANKDSGFAGVGLTRVKSTDSQRSIETARGAKSAGHQKERRHQIPGLRNTPYLKVLLLRCDDNDSYKNVARKALREWVTEHTTSASNENKQHDAFEWLIIHVVLPGTPAAQQPRSSSSPSNASGSSRWIKGSTTLLDKIRSDFNSGNNKKDRIVQIRIGPSHPALATLSPPVLVGNQIVPAAESPTESEMAWLDLIAKFKTQILASFDARVSQYEEDIKEKDSQRRLPGWNFCTFFVLKEGLARAFESVGLVEDALVLYDELGFGLDAVRGQRDKEKIEGDPEGVVGGNFVGWTKESIKWIEQARRRRKARLEGRKGEEQEDVDDETPVGSEKKPYRELILSNEISLFDFKTYLFARQSTLLLRLGKGNGMDGVEVPIPISGYSLHEAAAVAAGKPEEDLTRLSEVLKRGVEFVTSVGRILRADLWTSYHSSTEGERDKEQEQKDVTWVIDNIVSSWVFAVCQQLLKQTASASLPEGPNTSAPIAATSSGPFPRRSSSLPSTPNPEATSFTQAIQTSVTGLEDFAAVRADLMLLARGIVETFGKRQGWVGKMGWFYLPEEHVKDVGMVKVDLGEDDKEAERKEEFWGVEGIRNATLRRVVEKEEEEEFYTIFEELSEKAMKNYSIAKRTKSCERVEADLAALSFHLKDYASSVKHLEKMTKFYADQGWGLIETTLLGMYAKCLKEMSRSEDYIRVLLKLLAKSSAAERARLRRRGVAVLDGDERAAPVNTSLDAQHFEEEVGVDGCVEKIITLSLEIEKEITTPMSHFWDNIVVDPYPRHLDDRDGFEVLVKMRYLLEEEMEVQKLRVRIVNTIGQVKEVWMDALGPITMKRGVVKVFARSSITTPGSYIVDKIILIANKLHFVHELITKSTPNTALGLGSTSVPAVPTVKKMKLSFYPAPRSLLVKLEVPKQINLEHMKAIELVLDPGKNNVTKGEIRLRSATAGLRLMTASVRFLEGSDVVSTGDKPGVFALKDLTQRKNVRFRLPYTSENELTELAIKVEVDYDTDNGNFSYANGLSVPVVLPLAVNVQDVFKPNALFSRFQVSTAIPDVPLRILKASLEGSRTFGACSGVGTEGSMVVFAKQPASFVYKITRKTGDDVPKDKEPQPLALAIEYRSLDEEVQDSVVAAFSSQLEEAGLDLYSRLLVPILITRLRHRTAHNLEAAGLLNEIRLGKYDNYNWDEALESISPANGAREKAETWLKEFYEKNSIIKLDPENPVLTTRSIIIPVDVPQLQVIHTVDIHILSDTSSTTLSSPYAPPMVTVGQAIPAELIIRHSRSWNSLDVKNGEFEIGDDDELEFFYEIRHSLEVWLVSGRKRAHFSAKEGQVHKFPILLVPLKAGNLLLPNVEVKQVVPIEQGEEGVSCETDYRSNGESVLVLPDVRSTTVRIDSPFGEDGFRSPASVQ
ncbi:trafficking protein particle complex subunit 10 [Tuber brumale]|nr:trafficking protein particle complex subunit 10 [Tuber brumale]